MSTQAVASSIRVPSQIGKYHVLRTLGRGGFAVVVLAVDTKTKKQYAIKIVDRQCMVKKNRLQYLENELRLSARLDHPNVIKVHEVIYEEDIILIVMDYVDGGDLQSLISQGIRFSVEEQVRISLQILSALEYLHKRGIAHRDIKPSNILFDRDMNPVLIDFGLAKENASSLSTVCGTSFFMPPEVICGTDYDGTKGDIWSFGITLHVLCSLELPFQFNGDFNFIKSIYNNSLILEIKPQGLMGLVIKNCLTVDPQERPTSSQIMKFIEDRQGTFLGIRKTKIEKQNISGCSLPRLIFSVNKNISNNSNGKLLVRSRERIVGLAHRARPLSCNNLVSQCAL
ncbi:CAMK family protein kinase [Trichomonas vaginalis G3]|uniref:CAMK family protein kinase n=1 Tax=Trichomonas vaginalis (strain ATCC PRA-98 / G3) TaxID=412133 RepID=A2F9L4_TRIV3|nr:protein serine/threonine kinase protein [Trichomonas vaginalis G3]EAX98395.1 CAMK family protein kinase [Trichomonas vaginalis G3]KAI5486580.1 protein serine/threonine kinase protein [Trichomonas vaginalis G3]|eukprot:XP_001311325.1 CAMK family protein kinase [Trichomonas vaginalis G3]